MKKSSKFIFSLGCLLIVSSMVLLLLLQAKTKQAEHDNAEIVQMMEAILTDYSQGSKDTERQMEMPVLELQDEDFVSLLEIPSYGLKLPVCNDWNKGKVVSYPCRFSGTAYDGSLVIGGYDQLGQFDCFDRIWDGTMVMLTDMTGTVFSYEVERVERSQTAEANVLLSDKSDLTLFVRDAQLLEYIILRCVMK